MLTSVETKSTAADSKLVGKLIELCDSLIGERDLEMQTRSRFLWLAKDYLSITAEGGA